MKASFDYIYQNAKPNRISGFPHYGKCDQRIYQYYEANITFSHTPSLTLQECKKIVQAGVYFTTPLLSILNPDTPLDNGFTSQRKQRDLIENVERGVHDLTGLESLLDATWESSPFRIQFSKENASIFCTFGLHSFAKSGDCFVHQLHTLMTFLEASLSWMGSGLRIPERFPPSTLGLGRFMSMRGQAAETTMDGPDGKVQVITSFSGPPRSGSPHCTSKIAVDAPIVSFGIDEAGGYHDV